MHSVTLAARIGFWLSFAAITLLSLLPLQALIALLFLLPVQYAVQSTFSDKIEHFFAYMVLTAAGRIGYRDWPAPLTLAAALIAYGIAIEVIQSFIPERMMSGWDVFANTAGVLVGLGISWMILRRLPSRPTQQLSQSRN
ncbi:VanZ family protein [Hwanghaeella sp.]|uniref:VanZ family protein n=1 Tax=Hwanghaeella sp. TaxID=2605943 RepID=UPI003CCBB665